MDNASDRMATKNREEIALRYGETIVQIWGKAWNLAQTYFKLY